MSHRRCLIAATLLSGLTLSLRAQIVNGYAQVTALAGTTLTIGAVDETNGTFEDGQQAILMQMQDDIAGGNLLNNFNFGNLSTISSAGKWEVVDIVSHAESGGVPVSITLAAAPGVIYHFGPKCSVQLITFPERGTPDFTTPAPMSAMNWNGTLGGVVTFQVSGVFTIAHDIRADGAGFRGGTPSINFTGSCATTTYTSSLSNYGEKGDGMQRVDLVNYRYARGKLINAGGGGNTRNAGGGGGGNITTGGGGGGGYGCVAGGFPGISLVTQVQMDRFFMGGGGGGGQQNNSLGGAGGAGGGIVIIRMQTLRTVGPCGGLFISANGANGASSIGAPPDGAGGGGAGGSVYLEFNTIDIDPTCTLTCEANGGNGGGVTNTNPYPGNWVDCGGGGGGGGQGLVMCGGAGAGGNGGSGWAGMGGGTSSGSGGTHDPGGGHAPDGPGIDGAGVLGFAGGPSLPVELLYFTAKSQHQGVLLEWATATERDNALFKVLRSADGVEWTSIAEVPGAGNSEQTLFYSSLDKMPLEGWSYYRLEQIDLDGTATRSDVVAIDRETMIELVVYPDPANGLIYLSGTPQGAVTVVLFDALGRVSGQFALTEEQRSLDTSNLPDGIYQLVVHNAGGSARKGTFVVAH